MAKRTDSGNGGGKATSGGIEFQAATGALYCALMLAEEDCCILDSKGTNGQVESVAFEQVAAVDDIVLGIRGAGRVAIQAKRTLALSDKPNSAFASAIRQFCSEPLQASRQDTSILLIVSPRASAGVREVHRRLLDRYRECEMHDDPTTSKAERRVWLMVKKLMSAELGSSGTASPDFTLDAQLRRMHVLCVDPEDGGTDVRMVLALLRSKLNVDPLLYWRALVATCLDACKRGGTLSSTSLATTFEKFAVNPDDPVDKSEDAVARVVFAEATAGSYGRDLVLARHPLGLQGPALGIVELYRFDEAGRRRYRFDHQHLILANGITPSKVLARASTWAGIERLAPMALMHDGVEELYMLPLSAGCESHDHSPHAEVHGKLCQKKLEARIDRMRCLRCGEPVSGSVAELVEIDNDVDAFDVGLVHADCRSHVDRLIGQVKQPGFEKYPHLKNFDLDGFARAIRRGQMASRMAARAKVPVVAAWNDKYRKSLDAPYCIALPLRGNGQRYVTERGSLRRYSQPEAEQRAGWMSKMIAEAKHRRDPICFTSLSGQFGNYSVLETTREADEQCIECLKATVVPYTEQIGQGFQERLLYYAPLLALRKSGSGEWLDLDGAVPLLSDPFAIEQTIRNWQTAGMVVDPFACALLATDEEFDHMVASVFSDGREIVLDPLFDAKRGRIAGVPVQAMPDNELSA